MARKRSAPIIVTFVASLAVAVILLVVWVVFVVQAAARLNDLGDRVGVTTGSFHWVILAVGCALFTLLIAGITHQLAQALAARRYSAKQEEFISNMTHEMRSPLAAIKLHAQTLQQPGLSPGEVARSTAFILQQADRLSGLVEKVLESSRLLARKHGLELVPVDVAGFFAGYLEEAEARTESHGVRLESRVTSRSRVMATEEALARVMDNLIDNAERFSRDGGEVRCRVDDRDRAVVIEVEDDGVGVPRSELRKIFDRFYQAGPARDGRRVGSGLGLSIVSGLVTAMGGKISAHSQEGRPGTRFLIELPRIEATS